MTDSYYGYDDEDCDIDDHDEIAIVPVSREQLDAFAQIFGFKHYEDLASTQPQPVIHETIRAPEIIAAAELAGVDPSEYGQPTPDEIRQAKLEKLADLQAQLDELRDILASDQP